MPEIAILILFGFIWLILKIFEGASNALSAHTRNQKLNQERQSKYGDRAIDSTKTLFERNLDIIEGFAATIQSDSYRSYYVENKVRDCLNEICIAEGASSIRPDSAYLSTWRMNAPAQWVELSDQIEKLFSKRKDEIRKLERDIERTHNELQDLRENKVQPLSLRDLQRVDGSGDIFLNDLDVVLLPNEKSWGVLEDELLTLGAKHSPYPTFQSTLKSGDAERLNKEISSYNESLKMDAEAHQDNRRFFNEILKGYEKGSQAEVIERLNYIVSRITLPKSFPKQWDIDFDPEQGIAIIEAGLPDVVHNQIYKHVQSKNGSTKKPLNQKELKEFAPKVHPAIILRVAYEVFRNDVAGVLKLIVVNGWVEFDDPRTGVKTKTYTASLVAEKEPILALNLTKLDPLSAFINLKGKTAGKLVDIVPVTPTMSLNKKDKRFIETKEVLEKLGKETNLASMDWQDFESLIAELFEKEFADKGAEVKVTQASRDRGVDAVVFDPDPIKGGKFIIQAKRYTNTVDVSAVRDLCAVVKKEGASRGILATTSSYGADAYAFAQNEPVTLLNGQELLGLLAKHGYKFRINLAEARKLNTS